jgi:hypothetical protein
MLRQFFASLALAISLSGLASVTEAAEAGRLVLVIGEVQSAHRPAVLGAAVQEGDELSTGADGYVYMKTIDNGFLILRPNSKARITAYHIDQSNPANTRVKLDLLDGTARSISGQSVKQARQNFRFNTPVAAIGVRGTDFIVFTDQQNSRVSVASGGVVMSAFGGACVPAGGGPCEGSASRELFAGQAGMLLQVTRGQTIPELLHSPALAPDLRTPPRSDEPVGKPPGAATLPLPELSLDPKKGSNPLLTGPIAAVAPDPVPAPIVNVPVPEPVPPPVVTVPVPDPVPPPIVTVPVPLPPVVVRSPPEVMWGRWEAVAGVAPDPAVRAKLNDGSFGSGYVVGSYVIKRLANATFVLPREGRASFALTGSEVTLQKTGQQPVAAQARNGHLDIDFVARTFATGLTVVGSGTQLEVSGKGDITRKGELVNGPLSDAVVRGYLGGARAEEAGYLFKSLSNPNLTAAGATTWSR